MMFRTRILVMVGLWLPCSVLSTAEMAAQESAKPASEANSPEQAFRSAQTFQVAGDYESAAAAYREAISGAFQRLGNLRVSKKEYAEGVDLLGRAVQATPARVAPRVDLTIAHFQNRDFDKAKTEIGAAHATGFRYRLPAGFGRPGAEKPSPRGRDFRRDASFLTAQRQPPRPDWPCLPGNRLSGSSRDSFCESA